MSGWRFAAVAVALCAATGCSVGTTDAGLRSTPTPSPDAFAGVWRSVTPSLEFIGLSVYSKSSQMGVLGARLTFSGVAWEGSGRIEGDSLVASMAIIGGVAPTGVMVAHASDARTLRVRMRSATGVGGAAGAPLELTFVREN